MIFYGLGKLCVKNEVSGGFSAKIVALLIIFIKLNFGA